MLILLSLPQGERQWRRRRGKPAKLVITAVMRKIVIILNAIIRDNQPAKTQTT